MKSNMFKEELVISGISGKFPISDNVLEFKENLFSKKNLVQLQEQHCQQGVTNDHQRPYGKLNDTSKFDHSYFGLSRKQAEEMEISSRIILEKSYEAIVDAGYNPIEFKGTNTGVYIGSCTLKSAYKDSEMCENLFLGKFRTLMANRISYWLDIHGPSCVIDTGCSSSIYALENAYRAIQDGICNAAIVGGENLCPDYFKMVFSEKAIVFSPDALCKSFDENANGFARAEANVIILLQKKKDARRIYANLLHVKTNCDGYKNDGQYHPSVEGHSQLFQEFYQEINLNPNLVEYIEAHGTGTKVGDVVELEAIERIFCNGRETPLKIGSVKSNMGHAEGASGICSIVKAIITYENKLIPPNINLKKLNPNIPCLHNGKVEVVTESTLLDKGLIAINNYGVGGSNSHVLLSPCMKEKQPINTFVNSLPKLVTISGRTTEAIGAILNDLEKNHQDWEYQALYHKIFSKNDDKHLKRGYILLHEGKENIKNQTHYSGERRPLWYVFTGMGSQWPTMGKSLLKIPVCAESIHKSHEILKSKHIDLMNIITDNDPKIFDNILNCFVGIAAIQIALVDLLRTIGITPDGIIGHSVGEIGCAYADGCMTAEQMILVAYYRGLVSVEMNYIHGTMAAVGEGYEKMRDLVPPEIEIACHNGPNNCTISGPTENVEEFLVTLKKKNIFARAVNTANIAYHSRYIAQAGPKFIKYLEKIIPHQKLRSRKWICTSAPKLEWETDSVKFSSPEYHTRNLLCPVLFEESSKCIPENAITIEIAPHGLLQAILKRSLPPTVINVPLTMRSHEDNSEFLLNALGNLYLHGVNLKLDKLYPPIDFPVSRGTPMISPLIQWNHSENFVSSSEIKNESGERDVIISASNPEFQYLTGHVIDDKNLFPATGYLVLVWETFAIIKKKNYLDFPIVFEDVRFERATIIPEKGFICFHINVQKNTGSFEITNDDVLVASGRIYHLNNPENELSVLVPFEDQMEPGVLPLDTKDVYKELQLRGYQYTGSFKKVTYANPNGTYGRIPWENNFITFLDAMAHILLLKEDIRDLMVLTAFRKIIIDVKRHNEIVSNLSNDNKELSVYFHKNQNVLSSGGVIIKGFKCNAIPRKKTIEDPVLEKYEFVPYYDETKETELFSFIRLCVHVIFENSPTFKLKAVEILNKNQTEEEFSISKMLLKIISDIPNAQAEVSIFSETNHHLEEENLLGIKIETEKLPSDHNYSFAVTTNILCKAEMLPKIFNALVEPAYIITTESLIDDNVIENLGFDICFKRVISGQKVLLLKKTSTEDLKYSTIKITNFSYDWIPKLKQILSEVDENNKQKIVLYAEKDPVNGILGLFNCLKRESINKTLQCFFIMDTNAPEFSLENEFYSRQFRKNLCHNVYKNGKWGSYRHILLEPLKNIQTPHAIYKIATSGDLSTLKWFEGCLNPAKYQPNGKILIHTYYLSINFKDIILALGKISPAESAGEMVAQNRLLQKYSNGFEFCGKDQNGERFMGITLTKGSATLVETHPKFLWKVPDYLTLEEAATIPITYTTAIMALIIVGKLKKNQSVLIHAGSGGVGQAGINICIHFGCTIFTTVGSPEKVKFIRQTFPQIPESHIGCSRNTSFENLIMEKTNGRGVDLVLNSLSEDKLLASVRCLAEKGKFLEIGKYDFVKNNRLELGQFIKGISFHSIPLDHFYMRESEDFYLLRNIMQEYIDQGIIKPLNRTVFEAGDLELAYRYMASGRHTGKVLIKIREEESNISDKPAPLLFPAIPKMLCSENKSYVIIGGLGGFGLELADWLILRGAQKVVLSSRYGIKNGYQLYRMRIWKSYGANVIINTEDITTENGVMKLLQAANTLAPIGGIFNLAMVLRDDSFEKQTEETFKISAAPKAIATLYLDRLSRKMCPDLDHFVVFSSVSCGRGNINQTNYGMSNSIMERICETRKLDNLPALAVEWGAVGDVGIVAELIEQSKTTNLGGTLQQKISSCLEVLNDFMKQTDPIVSSIVVAEKRVTETNIIDVVANILGIKDFKSISLTWTLPELGLDSMTTLELKQVLDSEFDTFFTSEAIKSLTFGKLYKLVEEKKNKTSFCIRDSEKSEKRIVESFISDEKVVLPIVKLPSMVHEDSSQSNITIFYFPGIEGHSMIGQKLSVNLIAHVFSFQYLCDEFSVKFEKSAEYYAKIIIERLERNEEFFIIGHSLGVIIALEAVRILEQEGRTGILWLIDCSFEYIANALKKNSDGVRNYFSVLPVAQIFSSLCSTTFDDKFVEKVDALEDWKEKKKLLIPFISESFCSFNIANKIADFINMVMKSLSNYESLGKKLKTKATLIRSLKNPLNLTEDYELQQHFQYPIEIHKIDSDHLNILSEKSTAEIIMQDIFTKISLPRTASRQTQRSNIPAETPEQYYRYSIYIPWVDKFIEQLDTRFLKHEDILSNFFCLLPTGQPISEELMAQLLHLCELYANDLPFALRAAFTSQIQLWYMKFSNAPKNAQIALSMCDPTIFSHVHILLKILCPLPITISTAERSFSTFRCLKTYLRNNMVEEYLNGLALLNIHQEINVTAEEIVNILAKNPQRLDLVL